VSATGDVRILERLVFRHANPDAVLVAEASDILIPGENGWAYPVSSISERSGWGEVRVALIDRTTNNWLECTRQWHANNRVA